MRSTLDERDYYQLDHAPTIAAAVIAFGFFGDDPERCIDLAVRISGLIYDRVVDRPGDGRAHVQDGPGEGVARDSRIAQVLADKAAGRRSDR